MGEVVEVPGVREEDLRQAAMAKAASRHSRSKPLGPHEFTVSDWIKFVAKEEGKTLQENAARRELDGMVDRGILSKTPQDERRYDVRIKRSVVAYAYRQNGNEDTGPGEDGPGRGPP